MRRSRRISCARSSSAGSPGPGLHPCAANARSVNSVRVAGSPPSTAGGARTPSTKESTAVTSAQPSTLSSHFVAWTGRPASRERVGSSQREGMRSPPPRSEPRGNEQRRCRFPAASADWRTRYRSSRSSAGVGSTAPSGSSGSGRCRTGRRPSAIPTTQTVSRSRPTASSMGPRATPTPSSPIRSVRASSRETTAPTTRSRVSAGATTSSSAREDTTARSAATSGPARNREVSRWSTASASADHEGAPSTPARAARTRETSPRSATAAGRSAAESSPSPGAPSPAGRSATAAR